MTPNKIYIDTQIIIPKIENMNELIFNVESNEYFCI